MNMARICAFGARWISSRPCLSAHREQVKEEVLTRLKTIGRGGGLLIGPTHNLQLDTPLENFWAMVETIRQTPYQSLVIIA